MTYLIKDPEENRGISSHLPKVIFSGGEYESSCAQLENLFKLGCFGDGKPDSKSGRLLVIIPIFESRSVRRRSLSHHQRNCRTLAISQLKIRKIF